eukprot:m.13710 g.13710  ORF g.13710 m.13710 type:complete len:428 (-) comp5982_c0_seq1:559-1842(-)
MDDLPLVPSSQPSASAQPVQHTSTPNVTTQETSLEGIVLATPPRPTLPPQPQPPQPQPPRDAIAADLACAEPMSVEGLVSPHHPSAVSAAATLPMLTSKAPVLDTPVSLPRFHPHVQAQAEVAAQGSLPPMHTPLMSHVEGAEQQPLPLPPLPHAAATNSVGHVGAPQLSQQEPGALPPLHSSLSMFQPEMATQAMLSSDEPSAMCTHDVLSQAPRHAHVHPQSQVQPSTSLAAQPVAMQAAMAAAQAGAAPVLVQLAPGQPLMLAQTVAQVSTPESSTPVAVVVPASNFANPYLFNQMVTPSPGAQAASAAPQKKRRGSSKYPRNCPNPGCNKVFSSSAGFYYHIRTVHNGNKNANLKCTVAGCTKTFRSVPGLEYHLKKHSTGAIKDKQGRVLQCGNTKLAKRQAMDQQKQKSLGAEDARSTAAL